MYWKRPQNIISLSADMKKITQYFERATCIYVKIKRNLVLNTEKLYVFNQSNSC